MLRHIFVAVALCSLGAHAAAADLHACNLQQVASIGLAKEPGTPAIYAPVTLNGVPKLMIIDTGGVVNTMTRETAAELNLDKRMAPLELVNVAGQRMTQYVIVDRFQLAQFQPARVEFMLHPEHDATTRSGGAFAGSIAPSVFTNYDVEFDFASGRFNMFKPSDCAARPYWTNAGYAVVDISVEADGHIRFPMVLDGKRIRAELDTGSSTTLLRWKTAYHMFDIDPRSMGLSAHDSVTGTDRGNMYTITMKSLATEHGEIVIKNPRLDVLPELMSDTSGEMGDVILGLSMLKQLHFYIGYHSKKMFVSAASGPPKTTPELPAFPRTQ